MGTVPTAPTFAPGETTGVAAKLNELRDVHDFWANPPACSAYQSAAEATVTSVWKLVALQSELIDNVQSGDSPMHDNVTNNSRIVFRTPGIYEITGQIFFATNATGARQGQIRKNSAGAIGSGSDVVASNNSPLAALPTPVPFVPVSLQVVAGDYIEMFALQSSGGGLNLVAGPDLTFLRARLIAG